MKKTISLLLALAMLFAFAACSAQEEPVTEPEPEAAEEPVAEPEAAEGLTAIPLGGELGEVDVTGAPYGIYTEIELPSEYLDGETEGHLYYAENSDTPYIVVYRWAKESDATLEEETAMLAEMYEATDWNMVQWNGRDTGCYAVGEYFLLDDNYYYIECDLMEDGDDFVEIDFLCATEEVALGETGQAVYVPIGYTDMIDEDEAAHGTVFYGQYADEYDLPSSWIGKYDDSYEYIEWYWHSYFPDGLPFDEETYNAWWATAETTGWDDELSNEYYSATGCEYEKYEEIALDDSSAVGYYFFFFDENECSELYFYIGDDIYLYLLLGQGAHAYTGAAVNSLHEITAAASDGESACTIDLGGGLGEITLTGKAFGTYEVIDTPAEFIFDNTETTVYADETCDTPYIAVYRIEKGDNTLETWAQAEADAYSQGYYQMFEDNALGFSGAYICSPFEYNGNYYYTDTQIVEDGDEFVEISFFGKTEELQIGDTDVYAWVPAGYTDALTQDGIDHSSIFWGEYSEDYYFPTMWIGKWEDSYEYLSWLWALEYPDGLPISEEEYTDMIANWGEDSVFDYYEKMGAEVVFSSKKENRSYPYEGEYTVLSGIADATDLWFQIDGDWYSAWFESALDPKPAYAGTFLTSLHTK